MPVFQLCIDETVPLMQPCKIVMQHFVAIMVRADGAVVRILSLAAEEPSVVALSTSAFHL